jgi:Flp pilus assembly pilin Flp
MRETTIERGQSILEYALIFMLVVIVVIIVVYLFGPVISAWYTEIVESI